MTVTVEISSCHQCPHYTNSSREHNDPFTSEPFPVRHYCEHKASPRRIESPSGIDAQCPIVGTGARCPVKPVRIQLQRRKGWRMPANTVSVARPTKWGNPFRIVTPALGSMERETRAGAVAAFRLRLQGLLAIGAVDLSPLRGKNLACFCRLDQLCHADVLLEFANKPAATGAPA